MRGYTTREVAEILGLHPDRVRRWTRRGLLHPEQGPRGRVYSFQDIVLLRAARDLVEAHVPSRRVLSALEALRAQLPNGRPLSGVRITATGEQVVVRDADMAWEPESGQTTLDFSVADVASRAERVAARGLDRPGAPTHASADDWYDTGVDLEAVSATEAEHAYRRALSLDPRHPEAHLNLGRLLHERGNLAEALSHYEAAAGSAPGDARASFNQGVALEDLGHLDEACVRYRDAIALDPDLAEAHFNVSRLLERAGRRDEALQHLSAYRRLTSG